jgi:type II secretory pathway component PulC
MRHKYWKTLVMAAAKLLLASAAVAQEDPAAAAEADRARAEAQRMEAEARLEAARARLEEAAREIAELSADMVGDTRIVIRDHMDMAHGPRRVVLGVNIGPVGGPGRDGVRVQGVTPESAADAAGIRSGDILMSIDGLKLDWAGDTDPQAKLLAKLAEIEPGTRFQVEHRRSDEVLTADVEARERATTFDFDFDFEELQRSLPPGAQTFIERFVADRWGDMELVELTPGLGEYFKTEEGVLVVRAPTDATLGLEDGDVILDIAGRKPADARHVVRILRSYEPGEQLVLNVMRQGRKKQLEANIPE